MLDDTHREFLEAIKQHNDTAFEKIETSISNKFKTMKKNCFSDVNTRLDNLEEGQAKLETGQKELKKDILEIKDIIS